MAATCLNLHCANPDRARHAFPGLHVAATYGPNGLPVVVVKSALPGTWHFALPSRPFWQLETRSGLSQHDACTLAVRYAQRFC